jgi:antitoxin FitA
MWCTCNNVAHVSVMIQVRNVPDDVHRTLKARAAATGTSLSDYVKRELVRAVERATIGELAERLQLPLLTLDARLAAVRRVRAPIEVLGDVDPRRA